MNKIYLLLFLFALCACSSVPRQRIHNAASVPRLIDVNTLSFREDEKPPAVGMNGGFARGLAFSDVGNAHESNIYHLGINMRLPRFAFGWTPYLASAKVTHEGTGGFGSFLWLAAHFGGGQHWRFSYQNSFGAMNKTNEDKGCEKDYGFLGGSCVNKPESATRSEVKIKDVGFILTAERRVSEFGSLLFAPSVYWTSISTGNKLDVDPRNDYVLRTHFWGPGLQLGYIHRFPGNLNSLFTVMAGVQSVKTFRRERAVRELLPAANIKFQF